MGAHKRRTLELPLCGGGAAAEAPVAPILMASSLHHLSGKVPPLGLAPDPQGVPLEPQLGTGAFASFVAAATSHDE